MIAVLLSLGRESGAAWGARKGKPRSRWTRETVVEPIQSHVHWQRGDDQMAAIMAALSRSVLPALAAAPLPKRAANLRLKMPTR